MSLCGATHFFKDITEDAVFPGFLASNRFVVAVKFCDINTLGVDYFNFYGLKFAVLFSNVVFFLLFVKKVQRFLQDLPASGFSGLGQANKHVTMTCDLGFVKLHALYDKIFIELHVCFNKAVFNRHL